MLANEKNVTKSSDSSLKIYVSFEITSNQTKKETEEVTNKLVDLIFNSQEVIGVDKSFWTKKETKHVVGYINPYLNNNNVLTYANVPSETYTRKLNHIFAMSKIKRIANNKFNIAINGLTGKLDDGTIRDYYSMEEFAEDKNLLIKTAIDLLASLGGETLDTWATVVDLSNDSDEPFIDDRISVLSIKTSVKERLNFAEKNPELDKYIFGADSRKVIKGLIKANEKDLDKYKEKKQLANWIKKSKLLL